ncbi:MAG: hypothetical protein Q8P64_21250 [Deltaproteobacteria bacterium]|nr:hypothetical protein [Deltaproteobacteria bacterium]
MPKFNPTQVIFQSRFIAEAEKRVSMGRYERGFITEVAKSLNLRRPSVVQRWLEGYMPCGRHLVTIYEKWGVTPNFLLGIEGSSVR